MKEVIIVLMVVATAGVVRAQLSFPDQSVNPSSGGACNCVLPVQCATDFNDVSQSCDLGNNAQGLCCPAVASLRSGEATPGLRSSTVTVNTRALFSESAPSVPQNQLDVSARTGMAAVTSLAAFEQNLIQTGRTVDRGTPAAGHAHQFNITEAARIMDKSAWAIAAASRNVASSMALTVRGGGLGLRNFRVSETPLADQCPPQVTCSDPGSRFRTADGSCNNLQNPVFGKSNTPVQRILPPTYDDGLIAFRTVGVDGSLLPAVRNISNAIMIDIDSPDPAFTLSVMQWAQFMDHDFAHIPFPTLENGEVIDCCSNIPGEELHPRCQPIDVSGDLFYSQFGRSCMNFVRSMLAVGPREACTFGFAEQLNQLTHWIDGSTVYGNTEEEQRAVRSFRNGLLKTSRGNFLPLNPDQGGECEAEFRNAKCFLAGESRVNEQPGLTVIHTLWLREHNRIAEKLQLLNPGWSDEQVFQETRRIVIAEISHINFNEWLPIIIGPRFVDSFGLRSGRRGFSNDYDPSINPNMNNEFSTAAYRFGHSLVQGTLALFNERGSVSTVLLRNNFNSPHLIQNDGRFDELVRSLVQFAGQSFDNFVTQELSNHLFQTPMFRFGMDLMSLNMHRGRDHGIATYNSIREACDLKRARTFSDLSDQIEPQLINTLSKLYRSVDDIDLFAGGMSEKPLRGSLLGWTFTCIVGDQFARLKKGDRFFYDLGGQAGSFTPDQLQQLRLSSWARIICDNSVLTAIQPLAFQLGTRQFNRPVSCDSPTIPKLDFSFWGSGGYH